MLTAPVLAAHVGPWAAFGPWFLLIPLLWILLFVLIFVLVGRRWRRGWAYEGGSGGRMSPARSAEVTLAERFARGDIDEVEYRARLEVIRANAGDHSA